MESIGTEYQPGLLLKQNPQEGLSMKHVKQHIIQGARAFVEGANERANPPNLWKPPLVGFADVNHPSIRNLKAFAGEKHQLPQDVMADATIVLVYFVPFREDLSKGNRGKGLATREWAQAYETTNAMFPKLNQHLITMMEDWGFQAKEASEASIFYRDEVISHWSFRHLAYAAGLGTFGLNNMLITEQGCAGRLNGVVTNLDVLPDQPQQEEACLYKRKGSCRLCAQACPAHAITANGYDRYQCYEQCLKNAEQHTGLGSSYSQGEEEIGSEVCGKCIAGMPCALKRP